MDLLIIAFYLSVLTYYLGVLIYMLPVPLYSLKKWAPQLMVDGIFSATLVFSYDLIRWGISFFGSTLGADWNTYYNWLIGEVNIIISTIIMLKLLGIALTSIGLSFLASSMISPLISSLTYIFMFLITITTLINVLVKLSPTLLGLGVLLHSVPFRLTRSSGAMIIAVVVVFSIGTPLMPQFIDLISSSMLSGTGMQGYVFANIYVVDGTGTGIPYSLYEIYSKDNKLLARYVSDIKGYINASSIDRGIPVDVQIVRIDVGGYIYEEEIDPKNYPSYNGSLNITFHLKDILVVKPLRYIVCYGPSQYIVLRKYSDGYELSINNSGKSYIILIGVRNDIYSFKIDGVEEQIYEEYNYDWGGIELKALKFQLPEGFHIVEARIRGDIVEKPVFNEVYYGRDILGVNMGDITNLIYPVSFLVYRLFIGPLIYISILFSASIALAKLLGGSSPRIARLVVTGT